MNNIQYLSKLPIPKIIEIASQCTTKTELHKQLNIPYNGNFARFINNIFLEYSIQLKPIKPKWEKIEKECPVCGTLFKTSKNHPREKTVCSHSCSNTFFRSNVNNPNWKGNSYRSICFLHHKKECIICGEKNIISVHHFDHNHKNNSPDNLIPLCPTHHQYLHSRFKYLIEQEVINYQANFKMVRHAGLAPTLYPL